MPPKANTTTDLIIALRDAQVIEAIADILDTKLERRLQPLLDSILELKEESTKKSAQITKLQGELHSVKSRLEVLEAYTKRDNLLIAGLPVETYVDAAAPTGREKSLQSQSVEQSVIKLFNQELGVPIKASDISIAHRLKKSNTTDNHPPVTFVRFTNRKARDAVYDARRQLRKSSAKIYINEDLCKKTANIFHQARQLVRAKLIHSAWTSSCTVFIKESLDPNCRSQKILTSDDLPRMHNANFSAQPHK